MTKTKDTGILSQPDKEQLQKPIADAIFEKIRFPTKSKNQARMSPFIMFIQHLTGCPSSYSKTGK